MVLKIIIGLVIVGLVIGVVFVFSRKDTRKYNDLAVQKAKDVFGQYRIDMRLYKTSVIKKRGSLIVLFSAADETGGKGSTGSVPSFEVELKVETLEVVRSNFVR